MRGLNRSKNVVGPWSFVVRNQFDQFSNDQRLTTDDQSMTIRRMKTYTGGQGYVYQYYFVGKRAAMDNSPEGAATEYVFDVTSDRKTTFAVSVFLPEGATKTWAASHARTLTEAEQYGAVKMRLFQAFDEIENMMADGRRLLVNDEILERVLATLGVE
jgi:hypothetical protein